MSNRQLRLVREGAIVAEKCYLDYLARLQSHGFPGSLAGLSPPRKTQLLDTRHPQETLSIPHHLQIRRFHRKQFRECANHQHPIGHCRRAVGALTEFTGT